MHDIACMFLHVYVIFACMKLHVCCCMHDIACVLLHEVVDATKPLRDLLRSKNKWGLPNKVLFIIPRVFPSFVLYDFALPTKVSANASSYGLGAALLQKQTNGQWKPVVYSS